MDMDTAMDIAEPQAEPAQSEQLQPPTEVKDTPFLNLIVPGVYFFQLKDASVYICVCRTSSNRTRPFVSRNEKHESYNPAGFVESTLP